MCGLYVYEGKELITTIRDAGPFNLSKPSRSKREMWKLLPSTYEPCGEENCCVTFRKIEFVTPDCFLLHIGDMLTLSNLNADGIEFGSSYPCPSLFATMDGGMVAVLGTDDFGELYIDILMIHSFDRVLRVAWENEGGTFSNEWSSMSVNYRYLIMCSEEGRIRLFQFDRTEEGHIHAMHNVYNKKDESWYCHVELSQDNLSLALICSDEEEHNGLQLVDLSPLHRGERPVFSDQDILMRTTEEETAVERFYCRSSGNTIVKDADGNVDQDAELYDYCAFVNDNLSGVCPCAQFAGSRLFVANAQGSVHLEGSEEHPEYFFYPTEDQNPEPDSDFITKRAVEVHTCTTRRNGWKYDSTTVHDGTKILIINTLDHRHEKTKLRALVNAIFGDPI
jgi:hypothetical protein